LSIEFKDQVDAASENGIAAGFINSSLSMEEADGVFSQLKNGKLRLLYIAPERFAVDGFLSRMQNVTISHFAIDEAHCVSEWGHDFRPDYLSLSRLHERFPNVVISAFIATATKKVQEDIISHLKLNTPLRIRASFNRKELLSVAKRHQTKKSKVEVEYKKAVDRFTKILTQSANKIEISSLTKQLKLMFNLLNDYVSEIPIEYWENLFDAFQSNEEILREIILNEKGTRKKENADNSLNALLLSLEKWIHQNMLQTA